LLHATMPIETMRDVLVRSLAADRENVVVERAGAAQRVVAKARHFAWLAFAVAREIVAWAWETLSRTRAGKRTMVVLMGIAIGLLCVYAGVLAMLYFTQHSLMYFPETIHTTPAAAGLPQAEEVTLTTSDGEHIITWHVPPRGGKPVILYLHGNGGALRYRVERFGRLIADGVGIVAVEYRGYGGSSGSPSERGLITDGEAGYAFAAARYSTQQIVLWGESLGTGVAVALAAERPVGRVILEATFTSAVAVGAKHYWYMPVRLLMTDQFRSDQRIGKVTAPLLILHGVKDDTVPFAMGEALFDLANKPKHIVRFLDGGHEDLDKNGALVAVGRFLAGDLDP
jgi:fermentation-respiration switch protein FrsA (DUF1100 family)